ncbi:MAG: MBL fold metallo-hydrolase [Eubacterium sp.]|nr:MBL fold metallo-hydrolase [Eubacterium sp.]
MKTRVTVIVDNISNQGIEGEWGLSLLVEIGDKRILVDAGASDLFLENMKKLGMDVGDVDYAVLSHAHYDHANGMPAFFMNNKKAKLYVRDQVSADCYAKKGFFRKYIGIPKKMMKDYSDRIEKVSGDYMVTEGVYLVPHKTAGLSEIGKNEMMFRRLNGRWVPDDYSHEQSLVLETDKGLVIINSCSHGGAANIINEVQSTFPDKNVYGLIGGFHLFNKKESMIRELAGKICDTGIEYVCTGHCTKNRAYEILKEELGDRVEQMCVGFQVEF